MTNEQQIAVYRQYIVDIQQVIATPFSSSSNDGRSLTLNDLATLENKINYFKRQITILETGYDPKRTQKQITLGDQC